MTQRDDIVANAKYLKNVRPIDPEEVYEYVEGQPHPAIVRQTLRDEALDLGLVERPDGTFAPVPEDPVTTTVETVEALPEVYDQELQDLLVERFGLDWAEGDSGDTLRTTIRRLKDDYYRRREVEYDEVASLGYAIYHLPDFYAAVQYVLNDLVAKRLLPRTLRVLDVGAGVGGPALGLHDFLPEETLVDYHAVEPSAATGVLDRLLECTAPSFHTRITQTTAEAFEPEGEYDLVLFGNVLNELEDPEAVVRKYLDHLADDGSILALAPADKNTSTGLREVERAVTDEATVYSPTVRLWPTEEPSDRGWSFDVRPDLATPETQRRLDEATPEDDGGHEPGEFCNVDVQFSYSLLRRDGACILDVTPSADSYARMADMDTHVSNRIDLLAVKLSHNLAEPDANPLFKIGDGSEDTDHYAVSVKETSLNRDLHAAAYGDLLAFESVLALWNDDEEAYNLVVDEETVVDRIPKPV
ncbi:small ribosomal subunit Rsm22 family protein [Haloarchaeobius amylolyticus]|uniref:small ribosomal subunit Rsm22 family protein n=1 Tax=Haloarchaeobius amylolyticus TaxID=1198296 RepID=UPI002271B6FF|nr:class I SAM-dependent methyltransferase [Haloarchaeobius amylolyticus]